MRLRVSLPHCRSCTIAPDNATCQLWPRQVLTAAIVQRGPSVALGWGVQWQLSRAWKNYLLCLLSLRKD